MANITGPLSQLPIGFQASLLAFNIILSFTASLGNVLILLTLYKVSSLHPVTKFLFACLATTDLCVGLFSQPLFVADIILNIDIANTNLDILQHVGEFVYISSYVLCGVSVLTSTAISVDRLLVLLLRLKYRQVVTLKRAQVVVLLCWVIAVSCGLVRVWSQTISQIFVLVIGLVSLVTSVFCYVMIHLRLQGNQATVEDSSGGGQSNEDEEVGGGEKGAGGATEEGVGETTGAGRDTEEGVGETTGAGRDTEEGVGETTGAGRDTEEEPGAGVEGTGRATDEGSVRAGTAKVSPKRRIQERVRLNMVQYKKVVSSIFWLQLTLVACYAPFITLSLLRHTVLSGKTVYGLWLFTATLVYSNSSMNPFLYCCSMSASPSIHVNRVSQCFFVLFLFSYSRLNPRIKSKNLHINTINLHFEMRPI